MAVYELAGNRPRIHPSAFVHPLASVAGMVEVGQDCYVGPGASVRGDWVRIRIGAGSNVQDCCIIHGAPGFELILGARAHLGHGCIVHSATLEDDVLVGMNAVILDGAVLRTGCVVGSGCVVPGGMEIEAGKLCVGVPGRIVGDVRADLRRFKTLGTRWYQQLAARCVRDMHEVPLKACTAGLETEPPEWRDWVAELESYSAR